MKSDNNISLRDNLNRRKFIARASVAAASFTIIKPSLVRAYIQNSKIEAGIIGLGGRGSLICKMINEHPGYALVAVADYFDTVTEEKGNEFKIPLHRRYSTLSGYQHLIGSGVDAVFCETPPYCFPDHVSYAIKKNKHVYMAKPVACDVPGCLKIFEAAEQATQKKLTFLVDFQMPTDPYIQEVVKRTQEGDIGKLGLIVTVCGSDGFPDPPHQATIESRLRDLIWVNDTELGCGYIGNYDIHSLDIALLFAGETPFSAAGSSRLVRENPHGDSHDIYSLTYRFKNGLVLNHHSQRFRKVQSASLDCYAYGTEGYAETRYSGKTWLRSNKRSFRGGEAENPYTNGIKRNLNRFHREIVNGDFSNTTVRSSVHSTLACILGRDAAEGDCTLTWDEMMSKKRVREVHLKGLKT